MNKRQELIDRLIQIIHDLYPPAHKHRKDAQGIIDKVAAMETDSSDPENPPPGGP